VPSSRCLFLCHRSGRGIFIARIRNRQAFIALCGLHLCGRWIAAHLHVPATTRLWYGAPLLTGQYRVNAAAARHLCHLAALLPLCTLFFACLSIAALRHLDRHRAAHTSPGDAYLPGAAWAAWLAARSGRGGLLWARNGAARRAAASNKTLACGGAAPSRSLAQVHKTALAVPGDRGRSKAAWRIVTRHRRRRRARPQRRHMGDAGGARRRAALAALSVSAHLCGNACRGCGTWRGAATQSRQLSACGADIAVWDAVGRKSGHIMKASKVRGGGGGLSNITPAKLLQS
jgi:hypothetical protein